MQKIKLPQIQGHFVTLTLEDSILILEIEEEFSGKTFSIDLSEDSIRHVTNGPFATLQELFQALRDAEITRTLSMEELTFWKFGSAETGQTEHIFSLDQADFIEKTEFVFKSDFSFNMNSDCQPYFHLSDHNKTATSMTSAYPDLKILPQIPLSGQHCFSLRLNKMRGGLCCGITTEKGKLKSAFDRNEFSYEYWTINGRISGGTSKSPRGGSYFGYQGSTLKMVVDMDQGTLTFFVDNQQVNSCSISNTENYFAYISLGNAGDSVTLL